MNVSLLTHITESLRNTTYTLLKELINQKYIWSFSPGSILKGLEIVEACHRYPGYILLVVFFTIPGRRAVRNYKVGMLDWEGRWQAVGCCKSVSSCEMWIEELLKKPHLRLQLNTSSALLLMGRIINLSHPPCVSIYYIFSTHQIWW